LQQPAVSESARFRIDDDAKRARGDLSTGFSFDWGVPWTRSTLPSFSPGYQGPRAGKSGTAHTRRIGGHRVGSYILSSTTSTPDAKPIADLSRAPRILIDFSNCIILTQVLHMIYGFAAVMATLRRILKPGGLHSLVCPACRK
jgi:hypothetical protein